MAVQKRKVAVKRAQQDRPPKAAFPIGPDGKTANERLNDVLASHPTIRAEADLVAECNRIAQVRPGDPDYVLQQSINRFRRGADSLGRSQYVAVIAEALGVRAFWLQCGIGPQRNEDEDLLKQLYERRRAREPMQPPKK